MLTSVMEKMFLHCVLSLCSCRCWNLKTDRCVMALYGHTGTVNCLDLHGDRLVSGSKDRLVKGQQIRTVLADSSNPLFRNVVVNGC